MSQWTPSNVYTGAIAGTNCSITGALINDPGGYWGTTTNAYVAAVYTSSFYPITLQLKITPTKRVKSVSIPLTHTKATDSAYTTSAVKYYAKTSSSDSDWPAWNSTGTQFSISAAGTNTLTLTLSEATASAFYVYLWGYRVQGTSDTGNHILRITALGTPSCAAAAPSVHVKVSGVWTDAEGVYVKVNGNWVEADSVHAKVSGVWQEADG